MEWQVAIMSPSQLTTKKSAKLNKQHSLNVVIATLKGVQSEDKIHLPLPKEFSDKEIKKPQEPSSHNENKYLKDSRWNRENERTWKFVDRQLYR